MSTPDHVALRTQSWTGGLFRFVVFPRFQCLVIFTLAGHVGVVSLSGSSHAPRVCSLVLELAKTNLCSGSGSSLFVRLSSADGWCH